MSYSYGNRLGSGTWNETSLSLSVPTMSIDLNKYTEKAREAVTEAQAEARRRHHQQVDNAHLLAALLHQEGGLVPSLLQKLDISPNALEVALER